MTTTTLLGLITLGIMLLCLLMASFALFVPTRNKLANRLMAAYLLILATTISVFFYHQHVQIPLWLDKIRDDISALSAPLFFLYILSLLYRDFKLQWKHLWHLLPFVVTILVFLPDFYAVSEEGRGVFFLNYHDYWETTFITYFGHATVVLYLTMNFVVLHRYQRVLKENYSDNNAKTHRWLWQMTLIQTVLFFVSVFKNIFKRVVDDYELVTLVRIFLVSLILAFVCWLLFKIMLNPKLFRGVDSSLMPLADTAGAKAAGVDKSQDQRLEKLRRHMEEQQPYLDPTLTVKDLAGQLDLPERELSVLINRDLNRHFFDFVNDYRIEAAKRILTDPEKAKMTVLEILYAVGFNSKSSFNVAFKNRTKMTPTAFRRSAK